MFLSAPLLGARVNGDTSWHGATSQGRIETLEFEFPHIIFAGLSPRAILSSRLPYICLEIINAPRVYCVESGTTAMNTGASIRWSPHSTADNQRFLKINSRDHELNLYNISQEVYFLHREAMI